MIYLTADTHFGHAKVAGLRGFDSVAEHDARIIALWNETIADDDTVYHLGDFSFYPRAMLAPMLSSLRGQKHLILGNHDGSATRQRSAGWLSVAKQAIVEVAGVRLWLAHVPQTGDWHDPPRKHVRPVAEGEWDVSLCGHVHHCWRTGPRGDVNVGVDQWALRPVSVDDVLSVSMGCPVVMDAAT